MRTSLNMPLYKAIVSVRSWARSVGTVRGAAVAHQRGGDSRQVHFLSVARERDFLRGRLHSLARRTGQESTERFQILAVEHQERGLAHDRGIEREEARRRVVDGRDDARP